MLKCDNHNIYTSRLKYKGKDEIELKDGYRIGLLRILRCIESQSQRHMQYGASSQSIQDIFRICPHIVSDEC